MDPINRESNAKIKASIAGKIQGKLEAEAARKQGVKSAQKQGVKATRKHVVKAAEKTTKRVTRAAKMIKWLKANFGEKARHMRRKMITNENFMIDL